MEVDYMAFGIYVTVNGKVMCFATSEECEEWLAIHKEDENITE